MLFFFFLPCLLAYKEKKKEAFVEAFMVRLKYIVDRNFIFSFSFLASTKKRLLVSRMGCMKGFCPRSTRHDPLWL